MTKRYFYNISILFLFFLSALAIHHSAHAAFPVTERIPYSDFKKLIQEDKLEEVILDSLTIKGILKPEEWNLAIPRFHEDKFRVFRGQIEFPER